MPATGLEQFDKSLQTANIWLGEIMKVLACDRPTAWHVLGAVLHSLRDLLTNQQIAHLGGQLPLIVRGLFYDQWHPTPKPQKFRTEAEFFTRIHGYLKSRPSVDVRLAAQAVFSILVKHPGGETQKIFKTLPPDIRALATVTMEALSASPFAWE
jgi:uncharacterized protein (DUF2267 family)